MDEKEPCKFRWSLLAAALLLTVCSVGLTGCPDDDDDDDFDFKTPVVSEQ